MKRIGINGFGRIGRCIARKLAGQQTDSNREFPFELALINDLTDAKTLAHLLEFDSIHGRLGTSVEITGDKLAAGNLNATISAQADPTKIPWAAHGVDLVLECTGAFTARSKAALHLGATVKQVLVSAPANDSDLTVVYGVNEAKFDKQKHTVISCGSCTTNCLAPVAAVIQQAFGIVHGSMTTIHSYTNDQRILDLPHSDLRRARAAGLSMIPTSTGAAKAIGLVIPELAGKLDGLAIRVPTPNVSLLDLVCEVGRDVSNAELHAALKNAAQNSSVLEYNEQELVSVDFNGSTKSAIIDARSTMVIGKRLVKVLAWYDNETGFSNRMLDVAKLMLR